MPWPCTLTLLATTVLLVSPKLKLALASLVNIGSWGKSLPEVETGTKQENGQISLFQLLVSFEPQTQNWVLRSLTSHAWISYSSTQLESHSAWVTLSSSNEWILINYFCLFRPLDIRGMLEIYSPVEIYCLAFLEMPWEQSLVLYLFYHSWSYSNLEIQNCRAGMADNIFKAC